MSLRGIFHYLPAIVSLAFSVTIPAIAGSIQIRLFWKNKEFRLGIDSDMLLRPQLRQRPFPVRFIVFIPLSHWPGRSGSSTLMHQLLPMGSIPGPSELKNREFKLQFRGCPGMIARMARSALTSCPGRRLHKSSGLKSPPYGYGLAVFRIRRD